MTKRSQEEIETVISKLIREKQRGVHMLMENHRKHALHDAIRESEFDVAEYLLGQGVKIRDGTTLGTHEVAKAIERDMVDAVRFYLDHGIAVNDHVSYHFSGDDESYPHAKPTLLGYARVRRAKKVEKLLKSRGAQ